MKWLTNWRRFRRGTMQVLTMNRRNLNFIYPSNERRHFPLADNKLQTKHLLAEAGVPVPDTYRFYSSFFELRHLERDLAACSEFVIKPARGSGGGGILVIAGRTDDGWVSVSGRRYTLADMRKHIADIIFGIYSFGLTDQAIVEERIEQHPGLTELSPFGLTDVRVIVYRDRPAMAMLRVPTRDSDGKANLHQGALGIGIDIETGQATHAIHRGEPVTCHPDTGVTLLGRQLPFWDDIVKISRGAAEAVPLKYLGVDLAIAAIGPLILEINVRPGIEIQNANMLGLRQVLEGIGGSDKPEEAEAAA